MTATPQNGAEDRALTDQLAQQVLRWSAATDRYVATTGSWTPRWKFNPLERLGDAFKLLDAAGPTGYTLSFKGGRFHVEVEFKDKVGKTVDQSRPRAITLAVASALGIGEPDGRRPRSVTNALRREDPA